jgi:hypothetical protein
VLWAMTTMANGPTQPVKAGRRMVVGGARVRLACILVEQSGELYTLYKAPGAGQATGCGKVVASWKGHDRQPRPPAQENTVDRRETLLYTSPLLERADHQSFVLCASSRPHLRHFNALRRSNRSCRRSRREPDQPCHSRSNLDIVTELL